MWIYLLMALRQGKNNYFSGRVVNCIVLEFWLAIWWTGGEKDGL